MNTMRFIHFTQMVDTTQKCIRRIESAYAPQFGIKSVHIFWLYELKQHPNGLTAAELAKRRLVDRALISREMDVLKKEGLVQAQPCNGKNYNARLQLTEKGRRMATEIGEVALAMQEETSGDITNEELLRFYATFEKIRDRLVTAATRLEEKKGDKNEQ